MRRLLRLTWFLASLVAGAGTASTSAASERNDGARAVYAARISQILRARTYLDWSAQRFRMDPRRPSRGFARVQFAIDPSGVVHKFRVMEASSDLHARKAEEIVSGLRAPPPPGGGGFTAEQSFNFR
ncbi:MAG: hypothetical protein FJX48_08160 [Alphaproteobacteria bacterium]|nr:hypothetical protein [Alphaproteobacteria bacterium]